MLAGFAIAIWVLLYRLFGGSYDRLREILPRIDLQIGAVAVPTLFIFYHDAVVALTAEPYIRYHEMVFVLQVAAAFAGISLIWDVAMFVLFRGSVNVVEKRMEATSTLDWALPIAGVSVLAVVCLTGYAVFAGHSLG